MTRSRTHSSGLCFGSIALAKTHTYIYGAGIDVRCCVLRAFMLMRPCHHPPKNLFSSYAPAASMASFIRRHCPRARWTDCFQFAEPWASIIIKMAGLSGSQALAGFSSAAQGRQQRASMILRLRPARGMRSVVSHASTRYRQRPQHKKPELERHAGAGARPGPGPGPSPWPQTP